MSLKSLARSLAPPPLWRAASRVKGSVLPRQGASYQGVRTIHSTCSVHAEIYECYWRLDSSIDRDTLRLRLYYECYFSKRAPIGDLAFVGVSYGITARTLYDFVPLAGRTLHFVDPFTGMGYLGGPPLARHNTSPDLVRAQFPASADLRFHLGDIPGALPLDGVGNLAFVHLNTGDPASEAASLPYFFECLLPGGALFIDIYAHLAGNEAIYDPVLAKLGVEPLWLPTGQAVLLKA